MSLGTRASVCMPEFRSEICASFQLCTILSRAGTPAWEAERISWVASAMSASLALTSEGLTMSLVSRGTDASSVSRGVDTRSTCMPPGRRQPLRARLPSQHRTARTRRLATGAARHTTTSTYRSADGDRDEAGGDDCTPRRRRLPGGPLLYVADVLRRSRGAADRHGRRSCQVAQGQLTGSCRAHRACTGQAQFLSRARRVPAYQSLLGYFGRTSWNSKKTNRRRVNFHQ
jgi:hypothetical protein